MRYDGQLKVTAAYKRPNEADSTKWVVSDYFETPWLPENTPRKPLPLVLNLEELYTQLLLPLMPHPARPGENVREQVEQMSLIKARQSELEKKTASMKREKQFNRQVEMNRTLRDLKQELDALITLSEPSTKVLKDNPDGTAKNAFTRFDTGKYCPHSGTMARLCDRSPR